MSEGRGGKKDRGEGMVGNGKIRLTKLMEIRILCFIVN